MIKILPKEIFSTKMISEATETTAPKSQIYIHEEPLQTFITGAILEACIKYHNFYLVFMTDDIPYEESLRIYLLDELCSIQDYAELSWPYSTGNFQSLIIQDPDSVIFRFFGDTDWKIQLSTEKKFMIPFISEPRGVSRKWKLYHYFRISGDPKPEQ